MKKEEVLIKICDKYALTADSMSWSISEWKKRKIKGTQENEWYWKKEHWFVNFQSAVEALLMLKIRTSGAQDVVSLNKSVQVALSEIKVVLEPLELVKCVKSLNSEDVVV